MSSRLVMLAAMAGTLLGTTFGCFGDWVSARTAPKRNRTDKAPARPAPSPEPTGDPCVDYLAEVQQRCHALLDGYFGEVSCHGQLMRVMNAFEAEDAPTGHHPRPLDRTKACTQHRAALPQRPSTARQTTPTKMGPQCRAWAEALRQRCVAPLSTIPPVFADCGALLAFESTLGASTFGRPEDHEPRCREQVERLQAAIPSTDPPATASSDGG